MLVRSPALSRRSATEQIIKQSRDWSEFWDALLQINDTSQQGDAFERLTQLYLQAQLEYQSKLRSVWCWSEVPDEVRARLGLPATDEGIDILAETHHGDLWSIQCKFRSNPARAVTRRELGTFVALASVAGLSQRVVAHTSSKPIRKRALMGKTVEIRMWMRRLHEVRMDNGRLERPPSARVAA
jgi:predicted helicase